MDRLIEIKAQIQKICMDTGRDPSRILLVAVSKGRSVQEILELYHAGIRDFGENRVQEALEKQLLLPQDIRWHLIGTLQTKKVPKVVGSFVLIHSVDSLELATKLNQVSCERNLVSHILIQVNTSLEAAKHGFTEDALLAEFGKIIQLPHLCVRGLMTMARAHTKGVTEEEADVKSSFSRLALLQKSLHKAFPGISGTCTELSMGMSNDYQIAISEGATILRIGSLLFRQ